MEFGDQSRIYASIFIFASGIHLFSHLGLGKLGCFGLSDRRKIDGQGVFWIAPPFLGSCGSKYAALDSTANRLDMIHFMLHGFDADPYLCVTLFFIKSFERVCEAVIT